MTVSLDQRLFFAAAHDAIPGVTGELVWVDREAQAPCISLYVHPVLLVHAADALLQGDHVELVPHLPAGDPLLQHIGLVLQGAIDAEDVAGRLYAEALTHALAERFAPYTTAMRDAITHAADVGDADTAAVYTDISRGVDKRLQVLEAHLHP